MGASRLLVGGGDLPDGQEHRHGSGAGRCRALEGRERNEAQRLVECLGARLRVDHDPDAAVLGREPKREPQHEAEQRLADAPAVHGAVDCEPAQAEDGQRVVGQPLRLARGEVVDLDVAWRDRGVPPDASAFGGDVGRADVVPELVLAGVLLQEPIEVDVA